MEIKEITVYEKSTKELIAKIFEDGNEIKMIVSDEYEVVLEDKKKSNNVKVDVDIDTTELESKIEKLTLLLKEAKSLADDIASHELLLDFDIQS